MQCTTLFAEADWPKEWYEPPVTACQLGITKFSQSRFLDGRDLPPVAERLPKDPIVVTPLKQNGKYGGNARITNSDLWQFF